MAANTQIRPAQIAKDLSLKTKDIIDVFSAAGLEIKSQTALDSFALDVLWERLTRANQISNIEDYIDGITSIPPLKVKKAEPVEEEGKAEEKKTESLPQKPAEKQSSAADGGEKTAEKETKEKNPEKKAVPAQPEKPREKQNAARTAGERFEQRLNAASATSRDGQKKDQQKKQQQQKKRGIEVRERTGGSEAETVTVTNTTKVVDTRGSGANVDLSKYDEKLDTFAPDTVKDTRGGNKKLKKTGQGDAQSHDEQRPKASGQKGQDQNRQQKGQRQTQPQGQDQKRRGQQLAPNPRGQIKGQAGSGKDRRAQQTPPPVKKQPVHAVIPDEITVGEFASRIKVSAAEVVKKLMNMGMMVTVNQTIDFDTAFLIADELGAEVTKEVVVSIEEKLFDDEKEAENEADLKPRAPVVCVMGHVDHGKTSLLDAIRNTHVTAGEAGGITQHIGAYRVRIHGQDITFLDTPGHEAFTAMRARGAQATDIAILVVAADDGIMPQTVEAINHAKAAGVDIIVAINKMDKPGANPEGIKQELTKYDLVPEEWGGDVMCVPVSAVKRTGIDDLLESILVLAEVKEYKANPDRRAKGIIIESRLDRGRGPVATVLVQSGTLHPGDIVIAGTCVGRVRAMTDHTGRTVKLAPPSMPVEITGLDDVPSAGDEFNAVVDERMARELAEKRRTKAKEDTFKANSRASLTDLFTQIKEGVKDFNIIVKADVGGSAEAVKQSLEKLSNDEVRVHVIHAAAGGITEGDVMFAAASSAIIVGFNVRPDRSAIDSAERQGVEIRTYRVIYECIDEIQAAMKGMLAPKFAENLLGHAEVRQVIHVPNVGFIAGSYVQDGKITRSAQIRVVRDGVVVYEDKIASLRRFKDDVREVAQGFECGIALEKFNDLKIGDVLEAFVMEEIKAD